MKSATKNNITLLNQAQFLYKDQENEIVFDYEDLRTGSCQVFIDSKIPDDLIQKVKTSLKQLGFKNEIEFYNISQITNDMQKNETLHKNCNCITS